MLTSYIFTMEEDLVKIFLGVQFLFVKRFYFFMALFRTFGMQEDDILFVTG